MTRKIKQYKPIGFDDRPDPDTGEGHRNGVAEAAETRAYCRRMKELAAEDAAKRGVMLSRVRDSYPHAAALNSLYAH